jgi:hypothetical protein
MQIVKKFSVRLTAYLPRFGKVRVEMVMVAIVFCLRVVAALSGSVPEPPEGGDMPFQSPDSDQGR